MYADGNGDSFDLWVSDATTGNPHQITSLGTVDRESSLWGNPAWSPDGTKIAFSAGTRIWLVNPDGSGLHQAHGRVVRARPRARLVAGRDEARLHGQWRPPADRRRRKRRRAPARRPGRRPCAVVVRRNNHDHPDLARPARRVRRAPGRRDGRRDGRQMDGDRLHRLVRVVALRRRRGGLLADRRGSRRRLRRRGGRSRLDPAGHGHRDELGRERERDVVRERRRGRCQAVHGVDADDRRGAPPPGRPCRSSRPARGRTRRRSRIAGGAATRRAPPAPTSPGRTGRRTW